MELGGGGQGGTSAGYCGFWFDGDILRGRPGMKKMGLTKLSS